MICITLIKIDQNNTEDKVSNSLDSETLIEFHNVSKKYKGFLALDNISFKIQRGEIFGYIGPNGAGKTTTIKILVSLIKDYSGVVYVHGKSIKKDWEKLHNLIGYHPQEAGFQEWRTIDNCLKTFGRLSGITSENLENRIQEALRILNLNDVRNKKIVHLSGGMVQKLRLVQALLHEPEILVLDEPLTGLDPGTRIQFKKIIKGLAKSGKTILFSSHILSDVQDIADKIGILNRGKIMKIGTPEDLQNSFHVGNILEIAVVENTPLCKGLENISGVDYVEKIKSYKQLVQLKSEADIDSAIHQIIAMLNEQKCKVRNFNLVKPSLEDVYLKYVGGERD